LESVENALIPLEWFEACIDAHVKLGIKPTGARITAFDPASTGGDAKGYSHRKGILFEDVGEIDLPDGNDACDEAMDQAKFRGCDLFVYDADGMGALLRKQVADAFNGTGTKMRAYMGSNTPDDPLRVYEGLFAPVIDPDDPHRKNVKKNKDMFANKRAQYYVKLAQRMYNTYRAVVKKEYVDPDSLISISSRIKLLDKLRAEICHIPRVPNGAGKVQLMTKVDMKSKLKMASPNMADTLAMSMEDPTSAQKPKKLEFKKW
jgi:phage terminase large subunit